MVLREEELVVEVANIALHVLKWVFIEGLGQRSVFSVHQDFKYNSKAINNKT